MSPTAVPLSASATSAGNEWFSAPAPDEVEFTLFGPGFGECGLIHIGDGRWIVIDSCVPAGSGDPIALSYLRRLGFEPIAAVVCIIATHWHDDHVRGMGSLLDTCSQALFVCSSAMATKEFDAMVHAFEGQRMLRTGSGVREVNQVFSLLKGDEKRPPARRGSAGRILWHAPAMTLGHAEPVSVTALSPSDREVELSLAAIAKLMPRERETQYRCPAEQPNLMSIATHISIGPIRLLLGADIEHVDDDARGWRAVLNDATLPHERSAVFKIAHHGAESGHMGRVWSELLDPAPFAAAAPWQRGGRRLPTDADVARIVGHSENAYLTANPLVGHTPVNRPSAVERQLREMGARISRLNPPMGAARFRRHLTNGSPWRVDLDGAAHRLMKASVA